MVEANKIERELEKISDKGINEKVLEICKYITNAYGFLSADNADYLISNSSLLRELMSEYDEEENIDNHNLVMLLDAYRNYSIMSSINNNSEEYDSVRLYLNSIRKPLLTYEEIRQLGYKSLHGDIKARQLLIERNTRLVVKYVNDFIRTKGELIPFMDMIGEGNLGLIKAASKYNPDYNTTFSTYASDYICRYIEKAVDRQVPNVEIPVYVLRIYRKYLSIKNGLNKILKREASSFEIESFIGIDEDELAFLETIYRDTVSLDITIGEDDDLNLINIIPSPSSSVDAECEKDYVIEEVRKAIGSLKKTDQKIIYYRYYKNMTLDDVGKIMHVSRENIRLKENRIKKKLASSPIIKKLGYERLEFDNNFSLSVVKESINKKDLSMKIDKAYKKIKEGKIDFDDIKVFKENGKPDNLKAEYDYIMHLIDTEKFMTLLRYFTEKEILVYYFKKGYIFNRIYSFKEIASLLTLREDEVMNIYTDLMENKKSIIKKSLIDNH